MVLLLSLSCNSRRIPTNKAPRPHIIMIVADDLVSDTSLLVIAKGWVGLGGGDRGGDGDGQETPDRV